jgi:hypothetical protein
MSLVLFFKLRRKCYGPIIFEERRQGVSIKADAQLSGAEHCLYCVSRRGEEQIDNDC